MKVAFFTDSWKPNKDGVVYSIESLLRNLPAYGVDVVRIVTPSPDGKLRRREEDVEVWELPSFPLPFYEQYRFGMIWKGGAREALRDVEVVHSHGVGATSLAAALAAKELGLGSIVTFHTNIMEATHYLGPLKGLGDVFTKNYLSFLYSMYDVVVAPSKKAAKDLKRINIDARVVPNGINISMFKAKRKPSKKPLLIHVGRVVKEKNLDMVLDFFSTLRKKHPGAELWIIGDGPYLETLKEKWDGKEGVRFTGWIDREELKRIYSTADGLVFASLFDTQGLVVFEAMASGLPVIALKGSSAEEFVEGCGAVFSGRRSFVRAVEAAMESRCKADLKKIDERETARHYANLYREVLKKSR